MTERRAIRITLSPYEAAGCSSEVDCRRLAQIVIHHRDGDPLMTLERFLEYTNRLTEDAKERIRRYVQGYVRVHSRER